MFYTIQYHLTLVLILLEFALHNKYFNSAYAAQQSGQTHQVLDLIGSGNDRDCWRLANIDGICVKIAKPEQERTQNEIDYHYAKYLAGKNIYSVHMPKIHGWLLTDKGVGLASDLVLDHNGDISMQILTAIRSGKISLDLAKQIVDEAFAWLIDKKVILADYGINNLLVQNYASNKYRIVIVDGLGARHLNWNYWINRKLSFKAVIKAKEFCQMTHAVIDKELFK